LQDDHIFGLYSAKLRIGIINVSQSTAEVTFAVHYSFEEFSYASFCATLRHFPSEQYFALTTDFL
jgi:hypothetical protein